MDLAIRRRVERLLAGDMRNDDLTRIFLFARDCADGMQTVREIGDFVAHQKERNKGILTDHVRGFAAFCEFFEERADATPATLPAATPGFLRWTLSWLSPRERKKHLGLEYRRAERALKLAIEELHRNEDGSYDGTRRVSEQSARLINALTGMITIHPAFDEAQLVKQLMRVLRSQGVLYRDEERGFGALSKLISMFAVSSMHNVTIVTDTGHELPLQAGLSNGEGERLVQVSCFGAERRNIRIGAPAYLSSIGVKEVDPELVGLERWEFPIEIGDDLKLRRLG